MPSITALQPHQPAQKGFRTGQEEASEKLEKLAIDLTQYPTSPHSRTTQILEVVANESLKSSELDL